MGQDVGMTPSPIAPRVVSLWPSWKSSAARRPIGWPADWGCKEKLSGWGCSFCVLFFDGDMWWPHMLHEPCTTSRRVLPATLCCFCIGPCRCLHISARSGPLSECSLGSPRRTVWWLGSIATPTTTPSIWHTVVSCAESTQTKVAPWLMPSSCRQQRTIGAPPASPSGGAAACSGKSRRILQSSRSSGNCCNHRQPLPEKVPPLSFAGVCG